jgi:hypothetical protein
VTVTSVTTAPAGVAIAAVNNVTQLTCNTNVVTLIGSSTTTGVSYSWSGPNGYTASSSTINVICSRGVYVDRHKSHDGMHGNGQYDGDGEYDAAGRSGDQSFAGDAYLQQPECLADRQLYDDGCDF